MIIDEPFIDLNITKASYLNLNNSKSENNTLTNYTNLKKQEKLIQIPNDLVNETFNQPSTRLDNNKYSGFQSNDLLEFEFGKDLKLVDLLFIIFSLMFGIFTIIFIGLITILICLNKMNRRYYSQIELLNIKTYYDE